MALSTSGLVIVHVHERVFVSLILFRVVVVERAIVRVESTRVKEEGGREGERERARKREKCLET
jgi:hypothetical protein